MSTKVKGEAIKEGSIPLSALSSEVQEKIENSGSKVFVFTYDMVKSENEDGSLTIDPANAIEMINSDFINMMDEYNMEKTHTYDDFAAFSLTLKLSPLMSQVIVMYVYSEGVIVIMSAGEEHPFVYDSDSEENENKVRKRLSLLDLALGDSDRKDYTEYIDEVKENVKKNLGITDAVTPDWNAQEGEPGYIENRTHYINTKEGVEHTLSDLDYIDINEDGGKEWYYHGGLNNFGIAFKDYDEVLKYIDIASKEKVVYKDPDDSAIALTVKQVFEEDDATIVFRAEYSGFNNFKFLLFENVDNPIVTLDPQYIPYTIARKTDIPNDIIKTTPQTLSNTAKNQVLTNLGIDPVVWKYIMNPFVLQTGRIIPDELIASDGKSFKYSYAGMYNWAKGYAYDKDNFDYGNNDLEGFGSVHCPHNTMDYRDGNIYGAGNEIPPEGLPTSLSDMDDVEGPYGVFHDNWSSYFTTGAWCINKDTKQCYLSV